MGKLATNSEDWKLYRGTSEPGTIPVLPDPPPWRQFSQDSTKTTPLLTPQGEDVRGQTYRADAAAIEMVNAAVYLGRPLLVTGKPGTGKSSLAYSVTRELGLGPVLRWNITSRSTLKEGLYQYDALRRLQDYNRAKERSVGDYITLGALGTAFLPWERPRVLLIDEIDKSDIDLPNDLLNLFEEGNFAIPEIEAEPVREAEAYGRSHAHKLIVRTSDSGNPVVPLDGGIVRCKRFPIVILTSNGERDFPPPFLRRCLRLYLPPPSKEQLALILEAHLGLVTGPTQSQRDGLIQDFLNRAMSGDLATDQLLNAVFLTVGPDAILGDGIPSQNDDGKKEREEMKARLRTALLRPLQSGFEQGINVASGGG